jgi:hypothetical protein
MARKAIKMQVTTRALVQRINRALESDSEALKIARTSRMVLDVGRYFVLNYRINAVTHKHVSPETFGRELGVLQPWEVVTEE